MTGHEDLRLLGDIGGTNARFALSTGGQDVTAVETLHTADYPTPEAAIRHYLDGKGVAPRAAAIAVASPVTGDLVKFTNSPWSFSTTAMRHALELEALTIYNDFTAVALSLPWLADGDRRLIGGTPSRARTPIALVGPGTGLGVSGLVPAGGDGWVPLASEGGHVGFAPTDAREDEVMRRLRQRIGRLSAERLISGQGIENLYCATSDMRTGRGAERPAAEVVAAAEAGDAVATEALAIFSAIFGAFAGDLVLTLGAWRGLYIGGGIPMKLGRLFDTAAFNAKFEDKGRYRAAMQNVPRWLITGANPALIGLAHELQQLRGAP